jgi:GNAT superfamily N-acetyltransferase
MSVEVRWATLDDAPDLAAVLCEMAVHYRQPELPFEVALVKARGWLASESPAYPHFALAYAGGEVAGLASVAIAHPGADLERLLFLKDLFVRDGTRNSGAGQALIRFLARHCLTEGIGRIDLTTENWNEGALRFYDRLGAEHHDQKIFLRFNGDALAALAGRQEG